MTSSTVSPRTSFGSTKFINTLALEHSNPDWIPKSIRYAENEVENCARDIDNAYGKAAGAELFEKVTLSPKEFLSDSRPLIQRLVSASTKLKSTVRTVCSNLETVDQRIEKAKDAIKTHVQEHHEVHHEAVKKHVQDRFAPLERSVSETKAAVGRLDDRMDVLEQDTPQVVEALKSACTRLEPLEQQMVRTNDEVAQLRDEVVATRQALEEERRLNIERADAMKRQNDREVAELRAALYEVRRSEQALEVTVTEMMRKLNKLSVVDEQAKRLDRIEHSLQDFSDTLKSTNKKVERTSHVMEHMAQGIGTMLLHSAEEAHS